jgi:hypothetical protein
MKEGERTMQSVTFSDRLKHDPKLYRLAERANACLKNILGSSEFAAVTSAEWDRIEDDRGRALLRLCLRDPLSETTTSFPPWQLQDDMIMRLSLGRMWDDLLKVQLDVQHEKVVKLVEALGGD